jgi:hypothetical protein
VPHEEQAADDNTVAIPTFDLRCDGYATIDWAANYLENVRKLPVMAQVNPGTWRRRCPSGCPTTPSRSRRCWPIWNG